MMKRKIILNCEFCKYLEADTCGDWVIYCGLTKKKVDIYSKHCVVCNKFEFREYLNIEKECTKECTCYDECINSYIDFIENSLKCYDFECQCGCGYSFKCSNEDIQFCPKCGFKVTSI